MLRTSSLRESGLARGLALTAVLALGGASTVQAAEFGVPRTGDPNGYLILVGPDAVSTGLSDAFGDVAHEMTFYIEVARRGLNVEIYDPGLWSPTGPVDQLDYNFDPAGPTGLMRYVLFDPGMNILADQLFGPDDPTTEKTLVRLYRDNAAAPGLYTLKAIYQDEAALEQDVSVFGLRVRNHAVYTLNLTTGHANLGGATVTEPVTAYPYLVAPSAGTDTIGPLCGVSFHSYDLDSASNGVAPPSTTITTQQLFTFPPDAFPPSGDGRFWQTDTGGIPAGSLDSDDQGIYRWDFTDLGLVQETLFGNVAPMDINVFSIQVLDYGVATRDFSNWPVLPPVLGDNPRRIYLPDDLGAAPGKEYMGHAATIISGYTPITQDEVSTLEVVLSIRNPNGYDLVNVAGTTHVVPDPEISDPTNLTAIGVSAAIDLANARQINLSGTVPAGTTAEVRYQLTLSPTTPGRRFLTGDGSDFLSLAAPTVISYDAPYTRAGEAPQALGPICMIDYDIAPHPCVSTASLAASATSVCPGTDVTLDSAGSTVAYCPGGQAIFQWRVNGSVFDPFPAPASVVVTPFLPGTYTLEVMCSTEPTCIQSQDVVITTFADVVTDAGADAPICIGDTVDRTATVSGGTPPFGPFLWSTQPPGQPGDGATTATISVSPTVDTIYTFQAADSLSCSGSDSFTVTVDQDTPPPSVGRSALKMVQVGTSLDIEHTWPDLATTVGEYQLLSVGCDTDLDGICDLLSDDVTMAAQSFWSIAPGVQRYLEPGAIGRASFLVYYRIRAASTCTLTPGPP